MDFGYILSTAINMMGGKNLKEKLGLDDQTISKISAIFSAKEEEKVVIIAELVNGMLSKHSGKVADALLCLEKKYKANVNICINRIETETGESIVGVNLFYFGTDNSVQVVERLLFNEIYDFVVRVIEEDKVTDTTSVCDSEIVTEGNPILANESVFVSETVD